jgi:hypothetical protein
VFVVAWKDIVDLVAPLCAISATRIAYSGLQTWRRQLHGTAEYECARRLYRSVLKVRETIENLRAPLVTPSETDAAFKDAGIDLHREPFKRDDRWFGVVYSRRWSPVSKAYTEFTAELLEAEVLWGSEVRAPEADVRGCLNDLLGAIEFFVEMSGSTESDADTLKTRQDARAVVYRRYRGEVKDDFGQRLDRCVTAYEQILRPHLSRPST